MKSLAALSGITTALYTTYKIISSHFDSNKNEQDHQIEVPIKELIKEAYLRISTKQNMAIVYDMLKLDCHNADQILEPYSYTLKAGGKKIRLVMAVLMSQMFLGRQVNGNIPKQILQIGGLIEYLHCASLIIDDIEDQSKDRRGQKCSYLVYGLDRSINAGNLMYFLPFKNFMETVQNPIKKAELFQIFIDQMTISHMGQGQDVLVHKVQKPEDLPEFQEYETLTIAKTSSLLRMMARMMCVVLNRTKQESELLCQIMNYIGLAFQVTDDILNLTKNLGKGEIAQDLRQKKFTPIIHFMRDDTQFIKLFIKQDKTSKDIQQMLQMILKRGVVEPATKIASEYESKAQALLEKLKTPYTKTKFLKLMKFIIRREN